MNDLKFALRQLLKNPGFTVVAVVTLALGIGACSAMFSLVYAVLWRPLPFREAERLVWIENIGRGGLSARTTRVDNFVDWREANTSFSDLAAYFAFFDYGRYTWSGTGEPRRLRGVGISQNFLEVLGVKLLLGRGFTDDECIWNGRKAALLSHAFWQQSFAGDPKIVGRSLTLNGEPTEIIGVLPPTFDFDSVFAPGAEVELLVPFPLVEETARWGNTIFAIGRLKPAATIEQAQAEFDVISARLAQLHPNRGGGFGARMTPLATSIRGSFQQSLLILFAAVGCVLLIACVNLSNLLLARANARRKEFAVRVALGASRWRLIRQTLIESLILALLGCAAGVPLAFATTEALTRLQAFSIPLLQTASVNTPVLAFTVGLSCVAGLLCGTLPALQLTRGEMGQRLNDAGTRGSGGGAAALVRKALVVSEVAVACVLLVGAGLLLRSFLKVLEVDLGFQPKHAAAWRVDPTRAFNSPAEGAAYYDRLIEKVEALPGVESAGLSDTLPLGRNRTWGAGAKGVLYPPGRFPIAYPRMVDHRYLQTMQIPLLAGRYFDLRDTDTSDPTIVINQTMAQRLWPGREAVGQVVTLGRDERTVIGVVRNVRHSTLEEGSGAEMYLNLRQSSDWNAVELVVRSSRPLEALAPEVRAVMKAFDPSLPTTEMTTLGQIVDRAVAPRRLITNLFGAFSGLALGLAAIGLYGVIAYSVSQRTREIGIRLAIGAQRGDVLRLVMSEGFRMAAIGVALGLIGARLLTHVLDRLLYGITATDPMIFAANAALLIGVALLACAIPARRATRIDPLEALRYE